MPDLGRRARLAQRGDGEPVSEQQVVGGPQGGSRLTTAGCVGPGRIAEERRAPRLVQGDPGAHPVAEAPVRGHREVGESPGSVAFGPAAGVLERLREVPVVERRDRVDAAGEQPVDEPVVEVQAARLDPRAAARQDARPGQREAVGADAQPVEQVEVLAPAVVVIAGDQTVGAVGDVTRHRRERVPDRRAAPVLGRGTLDLVGRRRDSPAEAGREDARQRVDKGALPSGRGHDLTAPSMMPATIWRPATKKMTSNGSVARKAPARTWE